MPQQKQISTIIGKIYDAAAEPRAWNLFLADLAQLTGSTMSCLFWSGTSRTDYNYIASQGIPDWYIREYSEHFIETDEWFKGGKGVLKSGWVGRSQELCTDQQLAKTEFYSDFLRRADVFHQCGGVMAMTGETLATLSLLRPRKYGPYEKSSVDTLRVLTPHLQKAIRIHKKFVDLRAHHISMEAALQTMAAPLILTDSRGELLFANRAAVEILDRRDGLMIVRGRIGATVPFDSAQLSALLIAAAPLHVRSPAVGGSMLVTRQQSRPLSVLASPLPMLHAPATSKPIVMLFINDPESQSFTPTSLLRAYGLTPAEMRLASSLGQGQSLKFAAESSGVTFNTVRSQLKSIFSKLGVNRQSQLVKFLQQCSAPATRHK
jgi:DNA-binding CsgD family transcriptional regulator/PAS domain-containing protein